MIRYLRANMDFTIGDKQYLKGTLFKVDTEVKPKQGQLAVYQYKETVFIDTYHHRKKSNKYLVGVVTGVRRPLMRVPIIKWSDIDKYTKGIEPQQYHK